MANYSRIFGSRYPDSLIELSNFKDIGEATDEVKQIIQQFYTFINSDNYESANALYEANKAILKPYYLGMDFLNKLEEELYNTQIYVIKNSNTIISKTELNASDYANNATWLKPI